MSSAPETLESQARRLWEIETAGQADAPLWDLKEYQNELESPQCRFFGWPGEGPLLRGFVLYRVVPPEAWVMQLAVERKGAGEGTRLLRDFLSVAANAGCASVGLEVSERNAAARRLYASFGFAVIGTRKNYYRNGDNALVMKLMLDVI